MKRFLRICAAVTMIFALSGTAMATLVSLDFTDGSSPLTSSSTIYINEDGTMTPTTAMRGDTISFSLYQGRDSLGYYANRSKLKWDNHKADDVLSLVPMNTSAIISIPRDRLYPYHSMPMIPTKLSSRFAIRKH